ncbi:MAG: AmmeMemoRadiSam system protein B [Verrucomicrobiota bacterium]
MSDSLQYPVLPASHAGGCYSEEAAELLKTWGEFIDQEVQSMSPESSAETLSPVLIVPHIDFRVNLQHYVETYARLHLASKFPELVIILGVGHRCPHEFSIHPFGMETPLGVIPPDLDAWEMLNKECDFELSQAPESFEGEHSLEFVATWLEVIHALNFSEQQYRILPVLCGGLFENLYLNAPPDEHDDFFVLGQALKKLVDSRPAGSTLIIASIDGCHVGPRFGHTFGGNVVTQRAVSHWESDLWQWAQPDTYPAFFSHLAAMENMFHFDGVGVLSLLLQHFPYRTRIQGTDCWFEASDQSFVTFSSGWMK